MKKNCVLFSFDLWLPVMIFAFIIAFAVNQIGKFCQAAITFEKYVRKFTGLLFIGIGSFYFWRIF